MTTAKADQAPPLVLSLRNGGTSTANGSTGHPPPSPTSSELSDSPPVDPLREQIIAGLKGTPEPTIPGETEADQSFQFKRRVPTMVLYSEKGLQIYEQITQTKAYYPFEAEKEILETYGDEIACRMFGLPTSLLVEQEMKEENGQDGEAARDSNGKTGLTKINEKWGDASVGLHNYGVNGESSSTSVQIAKSGLAVELGSGSLDKTRHLLRSMAKLLKPRNKSSKKGILEALEYKALDLEAASLYSTLSSLASIEGDSVTTSLQDHIQTRRVSVSGLHATYDEGLAFLKEQNARLARRPSETLSSPEISPSPSPERFPETIDEDSEASVSPRLEPVADSAEDSSGARKTSILWLGSSIGNFTREEAVDFLKAIDLAEGDTILIGVDGCDDGPAIEVAYNDPEGVTRDFILEGVDVAGKTLHPELESGKGLCSSNFEYVNRWNATLGRHEAYIRAKAALTVPIPSISGIDSGENEEVHLEEGELLQIEVSYKYTPAEALALFHLSGFRMIQQWSDSSNRHSLYLVERPSVFFPSTTASKSLGVPQDEKASPYGVPSLEDWETMFRAWDWLMHDIIPPSLRFTKPIPLRHVPLFYIGHAPAFRDIHLSRYFNDPLTSPAHFADIFERGIDPDVEDQTKINHWHSEVPQTEKDWPQFEEIVAYEERVRDRVRRVYEEYDGKWERKMARVLMMVYEHEMMHFETSVYICLQACTKLNLPSGTSIPDFPSLARFDHRQIEHERSKFGKDARKSRISFENQHIEIGHDDLETNDEATPYDINYEFGWDCENPKRKLEVKAFEIDALPVTNGQYSEWLHSSVVDEILRAKLVPASWTTGEKGKEAVKTLWGEVEMKYAKEWPVAASADQFEQFAKAKGGRLPTQAELSLYLSKNPSDHPLSNLGLSKLHATLPTLSTPARDGSPTPASNGGLWEWTSSTLSPWEGFAGSALYPGYSSDFHDEKHRIVLGGSWASPRRIARNSFVNFYQSAYPYALIGARLAYDVSS
ncbi:uncharacterized protein JCM6883_006273 [Sporobolomyces salmoneus]|uniref:uncharacterized protein n=1 Tax=Sporobolomyces salmoneus TaxID=183962 RepID=UPI0031746AE1